MKKSFALKIPVYAIMSKQIIHNQEKATEIAVIINYSNNLITNLLTC